MLVTTVCIGPKYVPPSFTTYGLTLIVVLAAGIDERVLVMVPTDMLVELVDVLECTWKSPVEGGRLAEV